MRRSNINGIFTQGFLKKGLMMISGLAVLLLALVGAFYLMIAAIVVGLSASLISAARTRPQPVKVRTVQRPLDAEYRVIRRK